MRIVASRIYALFVVKSTSVPKLGGGRGGQANFGNAKILTSPVLERMYMSFGGDLWGFGVGYMSFGVGYMQHLV